MFDNEIVNIELYKYMSGNHDEFVIDKLIDSVYELQDKLNEVINVVNELIKAVQTK